MVGIIFLRRANYYACNITYKLTSGERSPPEELLRFKIVSLLSISSVEGVLGIVLETQNKSI